MTFKNVIYIKFTKILLILLFTIVLYVGVKYWGIRDRSSEYVPKHLRKYLRFNENYTPYNIIAKSKLNSWISKLSKLNIEQEVFNWNRFGPVESDTTIVVVQAGRDAERLQYLVVSLGQVLNIQNVLLIFSHSFYDYRINRLIRSIKFCKVMQLFYPYSLQLHPDKFPGVDPADCKNKKRKRKNKYDCLERDAWLTEHKQHWWWKANYVFDHLEWSRHHRGMVMFLEEDQYVFPDLLYMLQYATRSLAYFPEAEAISLSSSHTKDHNYALLTVDSWRPAYDRGLVFNKTVWRKIAALSSLYCMFNDWSWSYSLQHLLEKFPSKHMETVATIAPRVVSTKEYTSGKHAAEIIWWYLQDANLFPETVQVVVLFGLSGRVREERKSPPQGNGGWSDIRDQMLCLDPLTSTIFDAFENDSITTTPYNTIKS